MKIKLTRPQEWTLIILSLLVAFVLLLNFVLEFQKISSRRYITQSFPLQVSAGGSQDNQVSSSLRNYTFKRTPLEQVEDIPLTKQKGKGVMPSDPLKYGTITVIKKEEAAETPQEAQAQAEKAQESTQEQQTAPENALAQRVQGIIPSFDNAMQEKINQAIENPRLVPQLIKYTEQEIEACNTALAADENNMEAATKKERLMVLKSILVSTLNE